MKSVLKASAEEIVLQFDPRIYALKAIHAASYLFNDRYLTVIEPAEHDNLNVVIRARQMVIEDPARVIDQFIECLQVEQIRAELECQFGAIRDLIAQKALSPVTK